MVVGAMMLVAVHVLFALPILNEWWFALIVMVAGHRFLARSVGHVAFGAEDHPAETTGARPMR